MTSHGRPRARRPAHRGGSTAVRECLRARRVIDFARALSAIVMVSVTVFEQGARTMRTRPRRLEGPGAGAPARVGAGQDPSTQEQHRRMDGSAKARQRPTYHRDRTPRRLPHAGARTGLNIRAGPVAVSSGVRDGPSVNANAPRHPDRTTGVVSPAPCSGQTVIARPIACSSSDSDLGRILLRLRRVYRDGRRQYR